MRKETAIGQLKKIKTKSLKTEDPFKTLFSVDTETYKETYSKVYVNMDLLGFDKTQPIIVWKGRNIVIDGHTRLEVAKKKRIKEVWVIEKEFLNDDDAIQYAVHLQRDRRKLTDADIFQLVKVLGKRHPPGRPRKTVSTDTVSNPSNQLLGNVFAHYALEMGGLTHSKKVPKGFLQKYHRDIPYPDNFPKTELLLSLHKRIPPGDYFSTVKELTIPGKDGGKLSFSGDILEALRKFAEWAYGRSKNITATLIGTSPAKVGKCRRIIYFKKNKHNQDIDIEDIKDKIQGGKLTINRASSIIKNNGKPGNGKVHKKFQNNISLQTKNGSVDLYGVKWIILGTHQIPPEIKQLPKGSIICAEEQRKSMRDVLDSTPKE